MRQPNAETEIPAGMIDAAANSDNNHHHNQLLSTLQDHIHNHGHPQMFPSSAFDPSLSQEDFLEQMLSSSAAGFSWADDQPPPDVAGSLGEHPAGMRQQQIDTKALMFQQQLLLSAGANGNDVVDEPHSSNSPNLTDDASIKAFLNGFTGSLGQTSNQSQHFHHPGGALQQSPNFGAPAMSQTAASGSIGGGAAGQPKQRVRARRGQATDPHSIAERLRRERIAERMKSLQELVPNANKTDKASMLDEIIDYVKFLQLQVKVLSMSRLGGAAAVVADKSPEGKRSNGTSGPSSSNNNDGMTVAERQVAKLMEDDMGSAMQYLQGKGLCLMPISLATAISSVTSQSRNLSTSNSLLHGDAGGPTSPSISVLTGQSATMGGEVSFKDSPKLE